MLCFWIMQKKECSKGTSMFDVLRILKTGEIVGSIDPGINLDEWKCKVTASPRYPEDKREIGVVTLVVRASRLLIETVEWEVEI